MVRCKIGQAIPPSDVYYGKRASQNNSKGLVPKWEHNRLRNLSMLTPEERKKGQEKTKLKNRLRFMKVSLAPIPPPKDPDVNT